MQRGPAAPDNAFLINAGGGRQCLYLTELSQLLNHAHTQDVEHACLWLWHLS